MYNGLLRFNKHILNELAEELKHKAACVLLLGGRADIGSGAGSGGFGSAWVRSASLLQLNLIK